jgi:anthranilate synthase/aminodeoxychorismate synthase-like glutamine amidotransferase
VIVLVDNRDSFVHNLARYLVRLGAEVRVVPAHGTGIDEIRRLAPKGIVVSPGPCTPSEAGCSIDVIRDLGAAVPVLGVCLGHQAIAAAHGGRVVRAAEPVHGRTSLVHHDGTGVFAGLPTPLTGCRYHSLVVEEASLPKRLRVTARDSEGTVMGVEDQGGRVHGVQFHPESILTDHGFALLANFLAIAGLPRPPDLPDMRSEGRA